MELGVDPEVPGDFATEEDVAFDVSFAGAIVHGVAFDFDGDVVAVTHVVAQEGHGGQVGEVFVVGITAEIPGIGVLTDQRHHHDMGIGDGEPFEYGIGNEHRSIATQEPFVAYAGIVGDDESRQVGTHAVSSVEDMIDTVGAIEPEGGGKLLGAHFKVEQQFVQMMRGV